MMGISFSGFADKFKPSGCCIQGEDGASCVPGAPTLSLPPGAPVGVTGAPQRAASGTPAAASEAGSGRGQPHSVSLGKIISETDISCCCSCS